MYNESHSKERYERYCVNKPKSECVVKVGIYFLFKFFLGSMAYTYKEQLSCSTHCLSVTTYLLAGKLKMLARLIAPFFRYFFFKNIFCFAVTFFKYLNTCLELNKHQAFNHVFVRNTTGTSANCSTALKWT